MRITAINGIIVAAKTQQAWQQPKKGGALGE